MLTAALAQVCDSGDSHMIFVTGEAGVGKSRLVARISCSSQRTKRRSLQGDCLTYARSAPLWVVAQLVRNIIDIAETNPEEHQQNKYQTYLQEVGLEVPPSLCT